jgi:hypothetical protein
MPTYRVHFVDHDENIYSTEYIARDNDEAVIEAAQRKNVPSIGAGFDVWDDGRLVHRHRHQP